MKILIQNCKTGLFLTSTGDWDPNPAEAWVFPTSGQAVNYCVRQECADVQVVLKFEQDDLDVRLPLSEGCREPAA